MTIHFSVTPNNDKDKLFLFLYKKALTKKKELIIDAFLYKALNDPQWVEENFLLMDGESEILKKNFEKIIGKTPEFSNTKKQPALNTDSKDSETYVNEKSSNEQSEKKYEL